MAKSGNSNVRELREQRDEAERSGDAAKVAELDQRIREAERNESGTAQQ